MPSEGSGFTRTWQRPNSAKAAGEAWPSRSSLRSLANRVSPACRTGSSSTTLRSPHVRQAGDSNANPFPNWPSPTGGSWKKSPQSTTWRPPKDRAGWARTWRPQASSTPKSSESSMDTSSIMSTLAARHRAHAGPLARTLATTASGRPLASPTPAQLWIVTPPTLVAAMPVGAVTATAPSCPAARFLSSWITKRSRKDFPVPAAPLKKAEPPASTNSAAARCPAFSSAHWIGAAASGDSPLLPTPKSSRPDWSSGPELGAGLFFAGSCSGSAENGRLRRLAEDEGGSGVGMA
mmetsp:Transcript_48497/g.110121  ORF Transcript_48497/g.110121 Transcript_48497/m.110121 type:complete len:292 (+) Transcript_48497:962-1837(+)